MDNKYLVELSEIEAREIIGNRWISAPRAMKYLPAAFILLTLIMAISLSFVHDWYAWFSLVFAIPGVVLYLNNTKECRKFIDIELEKLRGSN